MADDFGTALRNGLRQAFCGALQASNDFFDAFRDQPYNPYGGFDQGVNRWLYRQFCNAEPPPPPPPPFTGGQCPVTYAVTYTYTYDTRSIPPPNIVTDTSTLLFVYGSVKGIRVDRGTVHQVIIIGGVNGNPSASQDYGGFSVVPGSGQGIQSASIVSVARMDGQPDTCGNPPVVVPPPTPGYNDIDITIEYSPTTGPNITIPVNFIFAPVRVNFRGEAKIPIDIKLGDVDARINGEFNLNTGDITFNFGNRNYPTTDEPKPPDYRPDDDIPDPPSDVPTDVFDPSPDDTNDDTVRIIRGVIVTVSETSDVSTVIFQNNSPDLYVPDLGHVHFGVSIRGRVAWLNAIPVRNKRHLILCPWEGGAQTVRGTPRPGVEWAITPIYLDIEKPMPLFP